MPEIFGLEGAAAAALVDSHRLGCCREARLGKAYNAGRADAAGKDAREQQQRLYMAWGALDIVDLQ